MTNNRTVLENEAVKAITEAPNVIPKLRLWTDDDHNLFPDSSVR